MWWLLTALKKSKRLVNYDVWWLIQSSTGNFTEHVEEFCKVSQTSCLVNCLSLFWRNATSPVYFYERRQLHMRFKKVMSSPRFIHWYFSYCICLVIRSICFCIVGDRIIQNVPQRAFNLPHKAVHRLTRPLLPPCPQSDIPLSEISAEIVNSGFYFYPQVLL